MRSLRAAMKSSPRLPQLEKARMQQRRPNAAKNKLKKETEAQGIKYQSLDLDLAQSVSKAHAPSTVPCGHKTSGTRAVSFKE